ncbi:hypothetical protein GCM10028818_40960 [Spirosoma horti]
MTDDFYPTVDLEFLYSLIKDNPKIEGQTKAGDTIAYILKGKRSVTERIFVIRATKDSCVDYEFATGIAIRLGCISPLLEWLEVNRNWKDGGYFVT